MRRNFAVRQLVSSLLLVVLATTVEVDAFSRSIQHRKRSRVSDSHQCIQRTHLLAGRNDEVAEDNGEPFNNKKGNKRNGIIRKDVKKLHRPFSKKNYQNSRIKKSRKWNSTEGRIRKSILSRWRRLKQKVVYPISRNTVYVLKCKNDKYYVGSTKNRKKRYRQHLSRRGGSKWTRTHRPIEVIDEYKRIPSRYVLGTESKVTAEYMYKYGVNNVRGAAFCKATEFTKDDLENLTAFLGHYNQLSYTHLHKELRKVLPDPPRSKRKNFPDPPQVFNTKKKSINTNKSSDPPATSDDLPKAVVRAKMRKAKRKENRKKKRELERKKYLAKKQKMNTENNEEVIVTDNFMEALEMEGGDMSYLWDLDYDEL